MGYILLIYVFTAISWLYIALVLDMTIGEALMTIKRRFMNIFFGDEIL